jgi:hypothetical protein
MTSHVTFIYLLGMGGMMFETPGGAITIRRKVNALHGTYCPLLLEYTDQDKAAALIREAHPDEKIMLAGDSCGGNRIAYVAAAVYPRPIEYMAVINASMWCNLNCPPVPDNVKEVYDVYGGFQTFGLSQFETPLQVPPPKWDFNDGKNRIGVGNHGKTKITYKYVDAPHPDDWDVIHVHDPIVEKAKELIAS